MALAGGEVDVAGAGTGELRLSLDGAVASPGLRVRCVVSNPWGMATSEAVVLRICAADFDCDGFVNGNDYDGFADAFDAGRAEADVNSDGLVNVEDYDLFAIGFDAGC
jgi:hypothetical protein